MTNEAQHGNKKTVLGCVVSWDSLGGVRGGAEGFAAEEEPEDDHAGGAGDGGQTEGRGGTAQVQQAAAQDAAEDDADGVGHGEVGLALDAVAEVYHLVDKVDGGDGVEGVAGHLKDLDHHQEGQVGGQPGEQGVQEEGDARQAYPGAAGGPLEQQGEDDHGGDVHEAL